MQAKELDTKTAMNYAWAASTNARVTSYANSTTFSAEQRLEVDRAKLLVEMCYAGKIYVNFRKTFAAIKIEKGYITDSKMLKAAEETFEDRGYTKTVTPQAVIYRIPKAK